MNPKNKIYRQSLYSSGNTPGTFGFDTTFSNAGIGNDFVGNNILSYANDVLLKGLYLSTTFINPGGFMAGVFIGTIEDSQINVSINLNKTPQMFIHHLSGFDGHSKMVSGISFNSDELILIPANKKIGALFSGNSGDGGAMSISYGLTLFYTIP